MDIQDEDIHNRCVIFDRDTKAIDLHCTENL